MSIGSFGVVFAVALLFSLGLAPVSRLVALRVGAIDRGGGRRAHEGDVPRLGGLGIYASWALATAAAILWAGGGETLRPIAGIGLGSLLLFAVGFRDDVRPVSVQAKLATQVAAAALVFASGVRIEVLSNPIGASIRLGALELPLTVLWLVAVTNAYNLIDGMDGLAATAGVTICAGMSLLYAGPGAVGPLSIAALAGALAGFLRHNFPPATIFMGDSGSQSVGFLLGSLSLVAFAKATTLVALVVPVVVFGHPLVDLAYAVVRRYHRGQSLGLADREHLHHKLLDSGYSRRGALGILVLINIGLLGMVLHFANRRLPGLVVALGLLTVPAGVGFRIARHIWRGGSVREEALAFFANRERRRLLHLGRTFKKAAPAAGSAEELDRVVRDYVRETGLSGVSAVVRVAGGGERTLFRDDAPPAMNRAIVCVTVVRGGRAFSLLEVGANRDSDANPSLPEATGTLADGVRAYLEANPGASDAPGPAPF